MEHFVWSANPVAFSFGPIHVFWYGILFAIAILSGLEFMKWVYRREGRPLDEIDNLFIYIVVGIVVGARLGHCLFYDPAFYLAHPMKIFAVWEGGLASHGGGLGVIFALYLYARRYKADMLWLLDRIAIPTALFAFFVRMGNFMNSEIIGKPTDSFFGIVFSRVDMLPRHPTQLYEAFAYLLIFFIMTWLYVTKEKTFQKGFLFGLFLILVFCARFLIEFVKTKQADYTLGIGLSTGQLLSIPFLVLGVYLVIAAIRKRV
jgi:prolipoprotein diacylglyceryl transferase